VRRAPLLSLCAASALALAGLVPTAAAQPSSPASPEVAPAARAVAQRTLDAAEAVMIGETPQTEPGEELLGGRDLTLLLRDLRLQLPLLRGEERARARALLARPTDGRDDPQEDGYSVPAENDCAAGEPGAGTDFCVHWVESTVDAPPLADTRPANGIPDQVDRTRATLQHVWDREIGAAGYRAPRRDAGPPRSGPNRKLDIYLVDVGNAALFGYCATENVPDDGSDFAAYCVLDDDYSGQQFPAHTPLQNLQVTAAHEFFHAVQFGYDGREDLWLMEGTATWMEDEVYDAVNDNRFYLDFSPLTRPERSLDRSSGFFVYGGWLWWRYLTEQHAADGGTGIPTLIRRVWEEADDSEAARPGTYSLKATRRVLADRGSSLTAAFAGFGVANRNPGASYEEGRAYRAAPLAGTLRLSRTQRSLPEQVVRLDHLSSTTFSYVPDRDLAAGGWRLRARVDAPSARHSPVVSLTKVRTDGTVATRQLTLDQDGIGHATVRFDSDVLRRVELTLANAGHRFRCHQGTQLSCRGTSKSEDRSFTFKVRLKR
jgi:hypothetical protein